MLRSKRNLSEFVYKDKYVHNVQNSISVYNRITIVRCRIYGISSILVVVKFDTRHLLVGQAFYHFMVRHVREDSRKTVAEELNCVTSCGDKDVSLILFILYFYIFYCTLHISLLLF